MKILYDNQIFATQKYGGVSRIFYELIKNLVGKENAEIYLFHGLYINQFPLQNLKNNPAYYFGKKVSPLPYTAKIIRYVNSLMFRFLNPGSKIDLFHPTDFSANVYKWKQTPLILTVYDMIPERFPQYFKDAESRINLKTECIQRADHIIAISQSTKNDILRFHPINENKITVVHLGIPKPDAIPTTPHTTIPNTTIPHSTESTEFPFNIKPYLLYVGTRKQGYKNFKSLLAAYISTPKINRAFNLVSFGGPPFTQQELGTINNADCSSKIHHISGNDHQLAQLYKHAHAFVYPSLYEGFGLPPLEAMTYGCPVIASNTSSIPEVLGNAARYFDPTSPDAITETLKRTLFDNDALDQLKTKGLNQSKKYSWSKMANDIFRIYSEMV